MIFFILSIFLFSFVGNPPIVPDTFRRLIIVPGGLITSPWVVLVVLVLVFVVPGVVFLVLVDVVACHYVYYH